MEAVDLFMLALLPVLLMLSAFFSGSETALFSLTEAERIQMRRQGTLASRAVEALLDDRRMLLITILGGNMLVNVLYFVLSSVAMLRLEPGIVGGVAMGMGSLLSVVLLGEVMPKIIANSKRISFALFIAPMLQAIHNVITPIRMAVDRLVVTPLSRLTAPPTKPPELEVDELRTLLEISSEQGVIDVDEQRILRDVLALGHLRVKDVMTPRVRLRALRVTATHDEIIQLVRKTHLTRIPVYAGDLDHIAGVLNVKAYLLHPRRGKAPLRQLMHRARFVPQMARLDQLLEQFRESRSKFAVVVDEYGGTAGVVTLEDVIERLVGDITAREKHELQPPRMIGLNKWQVDGDMSVHDWAEAFGQRLVSPRVTTVGGLITDRLGRAPQIGDAITLGNVHLEVTEVDKARVTLATLTLLEPEHEVDEGGEP